MEIIKKTIEKYPERANKSNWLELAKKDGRGVPVSTGKHIVKLLRGEFSKRNTEFHKDEQGITLYFDEDGTEKKYFVPMLNKDGGFHYLFEKFGYIDEGTTIEMEYVKKGLKGYIDVREPSDKLDDIPIVEDENYTTNFEEEL